MKIIEVDNCLNCPYANYKQQKVCCIKQGENNGIEAVFISAYAGWEKLFNLCPLKAKPNE